MIFVTDGSERLTGSLSLGAQRIMRELSPQGSSHDPVVWSSLPHRAAIGPISKLIADCFEPALANWTSWCSPMRRRSTRARARNIPAVVIPLVTQHYMMLARNLLYTGVTRGKRLVVLVGQRKALAIAVRNQGSRRRWSKLREHLANIPPVHPMGDQRGWQIRISPMTARDILPSHRRANPKRSHQLHAVAHSSLPGRPHDAQMSPG